MELKYFVVLAVLGAATGFKIPEGSPESSFPSSYTGNNPSSATAAPLPEDDGTIRNKRHLFFKKGKGQSDSVVINRHYSEGVVGYDQRPNREVHHHHHYGNNPRPQQPTYYDQGWERPSQGHHYHGGYEGGYASQQSGYYSGGYSGSSGSGYSKPNYGNGGYAQYGPPPQRESGPVGATPVGTSHNNVDRGQGAAAVNNIAIIHARAGSSTHNHNGPEEPKTLPKPMGMDFEDFSREVLGMQ
jgi:hypothetical protein